MYDCQEIESKWRSAKLCNLLFFDPDNYKWKIFSIGANIKPYENISDIWKYKK